MNFRLVPKLVTLLVVGNTFHKAVTRDLFWGREAVFSRPFSPFSSSGGRGRTTFAANRHVFWAPNTPEMRLRPDVYCLVAANVIFNEV